MPASHMILRGACGLLRLPFHRPRTLSHAVGLVRRCSRTAHYRTAAVLQTAPAVAPTSAPSSSEVFETALSGGQPDPILETANRDTYDVSILTAYSNCSVDLYWVASQHLLLITHDGLWATHGARVASSALGSHVSNQPKSASLGPVQGAAMVQNKPGLLDAQNFKLHWSVDFWRDFSVPPSIADPNTPIPSR